MGTGWEDFGPAWMSSFQNTTAYEVWNRITDPLLFDIVEPKCAIFPHPMTSIDKALPLADTHAKRSPPSWGILGFDCKKASLI